MSKHLFVGGSRDGKLLEIAEEFPPPTIDLASGDVFTTTSEEYHSYKIKAYNQETGELVFDEWIYYQFPHAVGDIMTTMMAVDDERYFHNRNDPQGEKS